MLMSKSTSYTPPTPLLSPSPNLPRKKLKLLPIFSLALIFFGYFLSKINSSLPHQVNKMYKQVILNKRKRCDPYSKIGVLLTNSTHAAGNQWKVIDENEVECKVVDFMSGLRLPTISNDLEFMRNKTVVLLGDSVDRNNLVQFCALLGEEGRLEKVMQESEISPSLPMGRERPDTYHDNIGGKEGGWANYEQGRPHICHVEKYNFIILNVFHYGLQPEDEIVSTFAHFYPPATIEERVDQIVLPILASLAERSEPGSAPRVPDIISITPGFWTLARQVLEDDKIKQKLLSQGASPDSLSYLDGKSDMNAERRKELPIRMVEVLQHLGNTWSPTSTRRWLPLISWRTIHHPRAQHLIPQSRAQHFNQMGISVIKKLQFSSTYAEKVRELNREQKIMEGSWIEEDLGERLELNLWGNHMEAMENHFVDDVHPATLPVCILFPFVLCSTDLALLFLSTLSSSTLGILAFWQHDTRLASKSCRRSINAIQSS